MKKYLLYYLFFLCIVMAQTNGKGFPPTRPLFITSTDSCVVTSTQADFQAGVLTNVELTTSPGDVKLVDAGGERADQVSSPTALSTTNNLSATTWTGQTFRAGITGNLTKITVGLGLASGTSGTITIEIRDLNGTLPGPTVLATGTLGPVTNVGTAVLYTTTFATPAALVSGTSYSIVLRTSVGSTVFGVRGSTAGGSTLANGQVFTTTNSGTTWTGIAADLYFTSYVTAPLSYQPSGNIVSGIMDANPDAGLAPAWTTFSWTATTPASTDIQFQAAASNSTGGPFNFVGPDGTAATFFTNGASLAQFNGLRYLKFKAFFTSAVATSTPALSDVTACVSYVSTLPVTWVSFTARKQGPSAVLNWSTAAEQNAKHFTVQHSNDGITWATKAVLPAAGNPGQNNYTYTDVNTAKGYNYYRIQQTDINGKNSYSETRVLSSNDEVAPFTLRGNIITNGLLQLQVYQPTTFSLYEAGGRLLWVKSLPAGSQSIGVSHYAKGTYVLSTKNGSQKILIQ